MDRYKVYKDSGVEWIGEIPVGWEVRRISSFYDARNEKVSDRDYPALSVTMQGIVPQLETAAKTQDGDNRKLVKTGDFVINSRSDRRGACGISKQDGSVALISNVLAPKALDRMSPRFYSLLFKSEGFADEYYRQGMGIVDDLWSTNWSRMKDILVVSPPLAEQEAIAAFLDKKTAEIDGLVADCEREVELLQEYRKAVISEAVTKGLDPSAPMKDSGVEWIGEIPEGWSTTSLQRIGVAIEQGWSPSPARDWTDDCWKVLSLSAIKNGRFFPNEAKPISIEEKIPFGLKLQNGDLLITRSNTRELVGDACLVDCVDDRTIFSDLIYRLTLSSSMIDPVFSLYTLLSASTRMQFAANAKGSSGTMPKINHRIIKQLKICLPPFEEQQAIVAYLDAKTAEIDSLIDGKRQMAEKLREYRKSLISEAVTGKFKVPGV